MTIYLALAQANFTVGDIAHNIAKIGALYAKALEAKADMLVLSEMAITGYPPEDLVLRRRFQESAMQAVEQLAVLTRSGPAILVGGLWRENDALYNAAFLLDEGWIMHRQFKYHLPNYGVFDEKRVFVSGALPEPVIWRGMKLGILVCEDMWEAEPALHLKNKGADLLISLNASPYEMGKAKRRREIAQARVSETHLPLIYVNQMGGQDELVFDGRSFVLAANGEVCVRLQSFAEDFTILPVENTSKGYIPGRGIVQPIPNDCETIYAAMKIGLRDFACKNGFKGTVLGLSGGIDSALSAALAVDALGADAVRAIMMPSPYTSAESIEDAAECAKRLNIRLDTIPIEPAMDAFNAMLGHVIPVKLKEVTAENIQPRVRGATLMAISNNEGLLLVTTGNKSEMSVGYATLYGDMCGGYNVLKDVYKTTVYKVARWRNEQGEVIPERILTKAPTAELKFNQTDQDTLPPYEVLDAILQLLVEQQFSVDDTIAQGFAPETVKRVARMLYFAEYKRRQAPPGVKITGMSFGRDRRYPITNAWPG